ncbi:MAG: hypothetical protein OEM52_02260 [bacterium]|nr:hypothetical protein [bacterium]
MRIGLLQLARLGDWVQTMPLFHALRQRFPNTEIVPLCDARVVDAVSLLTDCEPFALPFPDLSLPFALPYEAYRSIAVKLQELPRFDWILRCNDTPLARLLQSILTKQHPNCYFQPMNVAILRSEAVVRTLPMLPPEARIHVSDLWRWRVSDEANLPAITWSEPVQEISVAVGSGGKERQWGFERLFLTVQIAKQFGKVYLVGTAQERAIAAALLLHFPADESIVDCTGNETLYELSERLKKPGSVLTGLDSGALHFASFHGAATFGLYENKAYPFTTGAIGSIAAGCWREQGVESDDWAFSLKQFLNDPSKFSPEFSGEFRYDTSRLSRIEMTGPQVTSQQQRIRDWLQAFLTHRIPNETIAAHEPFCSLEKRLLHWEDRRYEPDSKPYPLFPESIEENLLTTLHWSLTELESLKESKRISMARAG